MYELSIRKSMNGRFVTVLKDGRELEPLAGLFISDDKELAQVQELIDLANEALEKRGDRSNG